MTFLLLDISLDALDMTHPCKGIMRSDLPNGDPGTLFDDFISL